MSKRIKKRFSSIFFSKIFLTIYQIFCYKFCTTKILANSQISGWCRRWMYFICYFVHVHTHIRVKLLFWCCQKYSNPIFSAKSIDQTSRITKKKDNKKVLKLFSGQKSTKCVNILHTRINNYSTQICKPQKNNKNKQTKRLVIRKKFINKKKTKKMDTNLILNREHSTIIIRGAAIFSLCNFLSISFFDLQFAVY